jgi:hypothetical protein
MREIYIRVAIGLAGMAVLCALLARPQLFRVSRRTFYLLFFSILVVTRILSWYAVFTVLGHDVPYDVRTFYVSQAREVIKGGLPYRDFASSYSPLFPYLMALPLLVDDSPQSLMIFLMIAELASCVLWAGICFRLFADDDCRTALLIYLTSTIPSAALFAGQDEIVGSLLLAAVVWLLINRRTTVAGLGSALFLATTKFISALYLGGVFLVAGARKRYFLAAAAGLAAVLTPFILSGVDPAEPLRIEGELISSGNLLYLASRFGAADALQRHSTYFNAISASAIVAFFLWQWRRYRVSPMPIRSFFAFSSLQLIIFMLLSRKSYFFYWQVIFFPACIAIAYAAGFVSSLRKRIVWIGAFSALFQIVAIEPYVRWFIDDRDRSYAAPRGDWLSGAFVRSGPDFALFVLNAAIPVFYVAVGWFLWRSMRTRAADSDCPPVNSPRET